MDLQEKTQLLPKGNEMDIPTVDSHVYLKARLDELSMIPILWVVPRIFFDIKCKQHQKTAMHWPY